MRKRKRLIGLICIIAVLIISGILYYKKYRIIDYEKANYKGITMQERDAINYFYKNKNMVIEGKCFDMKLTYFESNDFENIIIEVMKKVENEIEIKNVTITIGRNGAIKPIEHDGSLLKLSYKENEPLGLFYLYDDFRYISILNGTKMFLPLYPMTGEKDVKIKEGPITINLKYDNSEEKFVLENNQEKQYKSLLELNSMYKSESNPYLSFISNEYCSILFRIDFNRWVEEMNLIISEIEYDIAKNGKPNQHYLHLSSNFHLPNHYNYYFNEDSLREMLNINDEQYKVYLELLNRVKDLGITSILPEYLKE